MDAGVARLGAMTGIVVLAVALQGCGVGSASGSALPPPPTGASQGVDMTQAASQVDQLGRERFPAEYAGVELLADRVVAYRKVSGGFDQALQGLGLTVEVQTRDAPYSAVELQALADRVEADSGYWQGLGITISTVGARHDGTAVEVGTQQTEQATRLLSQRYGAAPPIAVVPTGPVVPATG